MQLQQQVLHLNCPDDDAEHALAVCGQQVGVASGLVHHLGTAAALHVGRWAPCTHDPAVMRQHSIEG
jgi:hypothetical protein